MTIDQEEEFIPINISVLTISDTRTLEDDKSEFNLQVTNYTNEI